MTNRKVYLPDRIFTGETWLTDHAVIIEEKNIHAIVPGSSVPGHIAIKRFPGCIFVPAFIDLQIYGADGKLLAVFPERDSLEKLVRYCRNGGASFCMPTVATNTTEVFYKCIDAIRDYWNSGGESVLGLHIEGPWINIAKKGAHVEALIHTPAEKEVIELLEYGKGVIKMITLAPEVCDQKIIDLILSYGIVISAGHSNATFQQATQGFENGITAVTHLYNAMSPLHHREPGLVGATLDHRSVMASIIPDGHHVDYPAIGIAKKIMKERLFVITDAVTETHKGHYHHQLASDKYEAAGILSGSALTMIKALQNLVSHTEIRMEEALRMCSLYPARLMRMDEKYGKIEPGTPLNILVLDKQLNVKEMIL